jgi:hypothetical protein
MKKVFVTFIVKLIRSVCPTESVIELLVYVLGSKVIAYYTVRMEKYFVTLDPYSQCSGVQEMWEVYFPEVKSRNVVTSVSKGPHFNV